MWPASDSATLISQAEERGVFDREQRATWRGEIAGLLELAGDGAVEGSGHLGVGDEASGFGDRGRRDALAGFRPASNSAGVAALVARQIAVAGEVSVGLREGCLGALQRGIEFADVEHGEDLAGLDPHARDGLHLEHATGRLSRRRRPAGAGRPCR